MRRRRSDPLRTFVGILLILVVSIATAAIIFYWRTEKAALAALDAKTGCPKNGIDSVTAVLIDNTDSLTPIQKASLRNQLTAVVQQVPKGGRLDIYSVQSTHDGPIKPSFSMCSPGRGEDVSELRNNPRKIEKKWKEEFNAPAWKAIDGLLEISARDESPLLESMQSISLTAFRDPAVSDSAERRLVIASDMIEFSKGLNMYKGVPSSEEFLKGEVFRRVKGDLRGVKIDTLLLRRVTAAQVQSSALVLFWRDVFFAQDGLPDRFYQITG
jgi:hypothetical protein